MDEISFRTATLTDNSESCPNVVNHLLLWRTNIRTLFCMWLMRPWHSYWYTMLPDDFLQLVSRRRLDRTPTCLRYLRYILLCMK